MESYRLFLVFLGKYGFFGVFLVFELVMVMIVERYRNIVDYWVSMDVFWSGVWR